LDYLLVFAMGILAGRFSVRRFYNQAGSPLQRLRKLLIALKRKDHLLIRTPIFGSKSIPGFTPISIISWLQARARRLHAQKCIHGRKRGRPPTPQFVIDAILTIKRDNPRYGANKISSMLSGGKLQFAISKKTVASILKANGFKPGNNGRKKPSEKNPGWVPLLYNQMIMAIDFKVVIDIKGESLFILNIIDHGRRVLHWSRATYHPTSQWVAQQLRNAFLDLNELPLAILLDRDCIFQPIVKQTLPAMGIRPIRSAYKCPWQNGVVERFHRTLDDELLKYVQPINACHLNKLLLNFRNFYNHARPHMANGGESPIMPYLANNHASNDPDFFQHPRKLVKERWLGGLHTSYRWAA
jgi:transposase InsO family protein